MPAGRRREVGSFSITRHGAARARAHRDEQLRPVRSIRARTSLLPTTPLSLSLSLSHQTLPEVEVLLLHIHTRMQTLTRPRPG